jgi:iron complex transport system permease protein
VGGTLLVAADSLARVVVAPAELPIGLMMALIGGPFFLALLLRTKVI